MYVKAVHPRRAAQLWEATGIGLKYGVITPPASDLDETGEWTWSPLLTAYDVPAQEVHVHGEPDVYTDAPSSTGVSAPVTWMATPNWVSAQPDTTNPGATGRRYFIKYATWHDTTRNVDVTVITGTDGDLFIMGDNGRTLDRVA